MAKLKLSPPWDTYYQELNAMFKNDPEVHVVMDDDEYTLKVYVDDAEKAEALQILLHETVEFGNITLKVTVIPANALPAKHKAVSEDSEEYFETLYKTAFKDNPVLVDAQTVHGIFGFSACYVIFRKEVVQYFDDNMSDINGLRSTLYETIAADIFKTAPGVFFCTSPMSGNGLGYAFSW